MKPQAETLKLETEGLQHEQKEFKIVQNRRMFEILSSNIYSDKPLAVIREYGCNAYDAHVAAGREGVPFEVHLPNDFEPWFSIRDFGTGLSHDAVLELYTSYGLSTKVCENESVGMFGLGSKSAFAYNDQFTVTSYFDGYERIYSAFLSADGVPMITMLSQTKSDKHVGLEIQIPVKQEDFSSFASRARNVFFRFPMKPVITGNTIEIEQVEYSMETDYYKLRADNSRGCYAVQGTVSYPIETKPFNDGKLNSDQLDFIRNVPIDFIFPIGSLDVATSREGLNYNKPTQDKIVEYINRVLEDIPKQFDGIMDRCKSLWEAKKFYAEWNREQGYVTKCILKATNKKIMWNGIEMDGEMEISLKFYSEKKVPVLDSFGKPTGLDRIQPYDYWNCSIQHWEYHDVLVDRKEGAPGWDSTARVRINDKTLVIFVDKKFKRPTQSMRQIFGYDADYHNTNIYLIKDYTDKEKKKILKALDGIPSTQVKNLSEYTEPPSKKEKALIRKVFECTYMTNGGPTLREIEYDVTQGGKYLMLYSGSIVTGEEHETDYRFNQILYYLNSFNEMDKSIRYINWTHRGIVDENAGWVCALDEIKQNTLKLVQNRQLYRSFDFFSNLEKIKAYSHYLELMREYHTDLPDNVKSLYKEAEHHRNIINFWLDTEHTAISCMGLAHDYMRLVEYSNAMYKTEIPRRMKYSRKRTKILTKLHRFNRRYPLFNKLLKEVNNYGSCFKPTDIVEYTQFCNKKETN